MTAIQITNLTHDYGSGKGVFDLSLQINPGETFGFLGPNGAGKTTTIRHLLGFIKPQQGQCSILGLDCWNQSVQIQRNLGYLPGEISFFDDMTGLEYLSFLQQYRGLSKAKTRTQELLDRFDVNPKPKLKKMSKGMKQKIGIVAAFMHDPNILILDEPTSGLDPLMQNRFIELLNEEKKRNKTILMSSHMFDEVERTCDRIGIIRKGHLVALEDTNVLRAQHVKSYTASFKSPAIAQNFAKDFQGVIDPMDNTKVTVTAKQTLEQIFLDYYGGNAE